MRRCRRRSWCRQRRGRWRRPARGRSWQIVWRHAEDHVHGPVRDVVVLVGHAGRDEEAVAGLQLEPALALMLGQPYIQTPGLQIESLVTTVRLRLALLAGKQVDDAGRDLFGRQEQPYQDLTLPTFQPPEYV